MAQFTFHFMLHDDWLVADIPAFDTVSDVAAELHAKGYVEGRIVTAGGRTVKAPEAPIAIFRHAVRTVI